MKSIRSYVDGAIIFVKPTSEDYSIDLTDGSGEEFGRNAAKDGVIAVGKYCRNPS
jgi:hypothetical protein